MRDSDRMAALRGRRARDESVFGLRDRTIGRRIAAAAVMRQGRWSSVRLVARYTRHQAAAEAPDYL